MKWIVAIALLLGVTNAAPQSCAYGPTTPRAEVNYTTTEEFAIDENSLALSGGDRVDSTLALAGATIDLDIGMTPNALVPQYHNSTQYVWFTGLNGGGNDDPTKTCGFNLQFDPDTEALPQLWDTLTVPIECLTADLSTTASWPITYNSDIEVWLCYDKPGSCDRVLPADVGFSAADPLSLFTEPLCQGPLVFQMTLTVMPSVLNETVSFALDYVRDEVTTTDPFFSVDGATGLGSPIDWSICDEAENGFVDFDDCLLRMNQYGGAKRVLELSVPGNDAKEIDLVFGLTGSDVNLVDATHPLTIDVSKSFAWLYHYPNNPLALDSTVSTCFAIDGCTDVTSVANLVPSNDLQSGFTKMKLHAIMPDFDEAYRCDEGYCVIVLRLNFRAANTRRQLGEVTTSLIYKDGEVSFARMLQDENSKPATQGMRISVNNPSELALVAVTEPQAPASGGSGGAAIIGAAVACTALIVAGIVYKKKKSDATTVDESKPKSEGVFVDEPHQLSHV